MIVIFKTNSSSKKDVKSVGLEIGADVFLADIPERAVLTLINKHPTLKCFTPGQSLASTSKIIVKNDKIVKESIDILEKW